MPIHAQKSLKCTLTVPLGNILKTEITWSKVMNIVKTQCQRSSSFPGTFEKVSNPTKSISAVSLLAKTLFLFSCYNAGSCFSC